MSDKIKISLPIIVEGKYDKNTLLQIFDTTVIPVGGFGIFNSKEKQSLIRKLAVNGVIVLTDADGAGKVIRSFLNGIVPKDKIYNLYIPKVAGKEKRKTKGSKEGLLGVEGMSREELIRVLSPFANKDGESDLPPGKTSEMITKIDFYTDKLTGFENSSILRDKVCRYFGLPDGMNSNALLEALNILTDKDGYAECICEINKEHE